MAISDLVQNVVIRYSAETGKSAKAMANLGVAISGITEALKFASEAAKGFLETQQLMAAKGAYSIKEMEKASDGLISKMDLLRLSAAAANTDFKMTQQQLNDVARYMIVLRSEGNATEQVMRNVTKAIVEGNARGLREFGEIVEGSTGKLKTHSAILERIHQRVMKAGKDIKLVGKDYQQSAVEMENAFKDLKDMVGELVVALGPAIKKLTRLIRDMVTVVGYIAGSEAKTAGTKAEAEKNRLAREENEAFWKGGYVNLFVKREAQKYIKGQQVKRDLSLSAMAEGYGPQEMGRGMFGPIRELTAAMRQNTKATDTNTKSGGRGRRGPFRGTMMLGGNVAPSQTSSALGASSFDIDAELDVGKYQDELGKLQYEDEMIRKQLVDEAARKKLMGDRTYLQNMFGPLEEFQLYQQAFGTLNAAATQAFQAWMDGSKSVTEAFKDMMKNILKGLATQMFSEAIKHAAMALGSLAIRDVEGARNHALAAAAFGAGAVMVGGFVRAYGGNSPSGGAAGAGAATTGIGSRHNADTGTRTANIFIGNDFGPFDRRERSQALSRDLKSLQGTKGVRYG